MKKIKVSKMDDFIYEYSLKNGLKVFIYRMPSFNKKIAYFQTKYGSIDNEFIPIDSDKMKKYPLGIAHFLEHKMFESKENLDYFKMFQENGAYLNAATGYDRTYYFFTCSDSFYDNLKNLIELVQSPYFTEENTEKEKGIIGQEIDMYKNDPNGCVYDILYKNAIVNDPRRYDIAGTKESINKITYKDLYECYNTFYHPSNMFLTITGDVDEEKTIKLLEEIESKKDYKKVSKIVKKKIIEPVEGLREKETIYHNVAFKKTGYAYKVKFDVSDNYDDLKKRFMLNIFIRSKFGELTSFSEDLIKKKLVKSYFTHSIDIFDTYALIIFDGDIIDDLKVKKLIDERITDLNNLEEDYNLYKKVAISNYVKIFESPNTICKFIKDMYNSYGEIITCTDKIYEDISYNDYVSYIKQLRFLYVSKVEVLPKEN